MNVSWQAQWIWSKDDPAPRNYFLCARKTFRIAETPDKGFLHIAADTKYRLFLNGEWLGDGPARSWREQQQFDTYDVTGRLSNGHNTIAVLVHHFGEGTFHYVLGQGGLLVQVEADGELVASTDETWKVHRDDSYERHTPRISCQMPFVEHYDARFGPDHWEQPSFDDALWNKAVVIGPAGTPPWTTLQPRTIPFLTREPVYPVLMQEAHVVKEPSIDSTFHIKPYSLPDDTTSNPRRVNAAAVTVIASPSAQEFILPPTTSIEGTWFLNGVELRHTKSELWKTPHSVRSGRLHKGDNLLSFRCNNTTHVFDLSLCGVTEKPVTLHSPAGDGEWMVFTEPDDLDAIVRCRTIKQIQPHIATGRTVSTDDTAVANIFNLTTWPTAGTDTPRIVNPDGFLTDNGDVTTVYPSRGGDVEILIDFGRELIGYIEMEIDAKEGTILDGNMFEAVEPVGRHYTIGNNNAFRYVARDGLQRFTSFVRRGMRNMTITLRNHKTPVKIHWVRCLLSTYPSVERGAFACSDTMLTKIWEVGRYTLRMCSEDTFTDCPTYEQTYWVGDARNEALINYAAYGDQPLVARCVLLPVQSLNRSALTESQVPSAWQNILTAWSLLWILMVEEYHTWSGDLKTVRKAWKGVMGNIKACRKMIDERGLLSIDEWNLFDWAPQDINHKVVSHNQMFLVGALTSTIKMAKALGKKKDADFCHEFRAQVIHAINKHLWDDKRNAYIDAIHNDGTPSTVCSQQTNSLALLYDVPTPARAKRIKDWPVNPPADAVKVGSPFALFYILEAMAAEGRHADLLSTVRQRWGAMIDAGATTFWETFPGWEHSFYSRSLCHAWSAGPTYFLSRYQLGIEPAKPGYDAARICPVPLDLTWCRGAIPTPHGSISVDWKRDDSSFTIKIEAPSSIELMIELPVDAGKFSQLMIDGAKKLPPGVKKAKRGGHWHVQLSKGRAVTIRAQK